MQIAPATTLELMQAYAHIPDSKYSQLVPAGLTGVDLLKKAQADLDLWTSLDELCSKVLQLSRLENRNVSELL